MGRLGAVAHALNRGETALAMTSAVLLKFPEPDWNAAVRIARADELLKYDPDEPRDWHGRWTTTAGGAATKPKVQVLSSPLGREVDDLLDIAERHDGIFGHDQETAEDEAKPDPFSLSPDWVHLPPGDRNDEIGDLLEWVANAKPSDTPEIYKEIDRQFIQAGDLDDAIKLGDALLYITKKNDPTTADRQAILDKYEYLTHVDPIEAGRATIDAAAQVMQAAMVPGGGPPEEPPASENEPVARNPDQPSESWEKGWADRGNDLEKKYGGPGKLPPNYPTIDRFWDGIATSWKSIDLRAGTYQAPARLTSRLNSYLDKVNDFNGAIWGEEKIMPEQIKGKSSNVVIPKGSMTSAQRTVFDTVRSRAQEMGINFSFVED